MKSSHCTAIVALFAASLLFRSDAQQSIRVTVHTAKVMNPLTRDVVGAYTQTGDASLLTPQSLTQLRSAGITSLTYPTGWQGSADLYHWSTNTFTPKAGNADAPRQVGLAPGNDMGHLALALAGTGISPLIHVNYGSNASGTGGGEPQEAAAWVAYCNGAPDSKQEIGKDSGGTDWKTVGYWATIRASQPLSADDGYNFLRISHPESLHIQLWQVGDDVANNGYYGGEHKAGFDLHTPYPAASRDNDKRRKSKGLSPATYGAHVVEFVAAMKSVDPKISVGASLTAPPVAGTPAWADNWNSDVLRSACKSVDFVSLAWYPGQTLPPDWKTLDDESVLNAPGAPFANLVSEMLYEDKHFCPDGKIPRLVLSELAPIPWGVEKQPIVKGLFAADMFATLAEAGIANAAWFQLRNDGLTGDDGKPTSSYYGTQMFHIIAFRPGDSMLSTSGATATVGVHATHRQDSLVGVMLINRDPSQKASISVSLDGSSLGGNGLEFLYGPDQVTKASGPVRSEIKTDSGSVSVEVPPYSVVDLLLQLKK